MTDTIIVTDSYDLPAGQELDFVDQDGFVLRGSHHQGSPSLTNEGRIDVSSKDTGFVYGVTGDINHAAASASFDNGDGGALTVTAKTGEAVGVSLEFSSNSFVNGGSISIVGSEAIGGVFSHHSEATNDGVIACHSSNYAKGVDFQGSGDFTNTGLIEADGRQTGLGVLQYGGDFDNSGRIIAHGGNGASGVGLAQTVASFTNSGLISAHVDTGQSIGVGLSQNMDGPSFEIDNSGAISADIAIDDERQIGSTIVDNTGSIRGELDMGLGADTVTNSGTVIGDIHLGDANDTYDGALGHERGSVLGEAGDDTLTGGGKADNLVGGDGDDVLSGGGRADIITGGAGSDTITGGAGNDRLVYLATSNSTNANPDQITDIGARDFIDLGQIDADTTTAGDQAFHLVSAFTGHAGELVVHYDSVDNLTLVQGDVDGDGNADMTIELLGDHAGFTSFVL